jgi:hypothetical protein
VFLLPRSTNVRARAVRTPEANVVTRGDHDNGILNLAVLEADSTSQTKSLKLLVGCKLPIIEELALDAAPAHLPRLLIKAPNDSSLEASRLHFLRSNRLRTST